MARSSIMHKRQGVSVLPRWLSWLIGLTFLVTACAVSSLAYLTASAYLHRPFNPLAGVGEGLEVITEGEGLLPVIVIEEGEPSQIGEVEATQTAEAIQEMAEVTSQRVTILLMGIDRRPGEAFVSRTDSMMLLSYNPETNKASILSIPRDMYAEIPGYGRNRINTAFVYGAQAGDPAAGAKLAMEAVAYNLGVPVDHYLLVDFSAFIKIIDALGGIDVNVPREIYDPQYPDMNYGFDPLYIPAGVQHFDGLTALKYARTRHQDNDFGRAMRQQQVLLALRSKAVSLGMTELLRQAPFFYQQFSEGIRTDLSLAQLMGLASSVSEIPSENIRSEVLDYDYMVSYTTEQGASVLVLQNDKAAPLIQELFFD